MNQYSPAHPLTIVEGTVNYEGLNIREHFAIKILSGLVAKYTMNAPEDQDTVCQMAVELANNLIKHLNNDY